MQSEAIVCYRDSSKRSIKSPVEKLDPLCKRACTSRFPFQCWLL